jgi:hypothetical protein
MPEDCEPVDPKLNQSLDPKLKKSEQNNNAQKQNGSHAHSSTVNPTKTSSEQN